MITIFKTGEIKYPESLNKPVKYDIDFKEYCFKHSICQDYS